MEEEKKVTISILTDVFDLEYEDRKQTEQELFDHLANHIAWLLESNKDFLLSLLYRLDVLEPKINRALSPGNPIPPHVALAQLIIERQIERMETRQKYASRPTKDPDIEGW